LLNRDETPLNLGQSEWKSRKHWPNLHRDDFEERSPVDYDYNCVAYAAGVEDRKWWPCDNEEYWWPPGVPAEETVDAFAQAYATIGYEHCEGPEQEAGYEKIAIYAHEEGPAHVARQRRSGSWVSKLGDLKDIEHWTLDCLIGDFYGQPALFMRRPRD
jgi:hypothetical protein